MRCWQLNLHSRISLVCQVHFYRCTGLVIQYMSLRHVKPIYFGSLLAEKIDETSENIYREHIWSVFFLLEKCKKINSDTMECQEFPLLNVFDLQGQYLVVSFDLPPSFAGLKPWVTKATSWLVHFEGLMYRNMSSSEKERQSFPQVTQLPQESLLMKSYGIEH